MGHGKVDDRRVCGDSVCVPVSYSSWTEGHYHCTYWTEGHYHCTYWTEGHYHCTYWTEGHYHCTYGKCMLKLR